MPAARPVTGVRRHLRSSGSSFSFVTEQLAELLGPARTRRRAYAADHTRLGPDAELSAMDGAALRDVVDRLIKGWHPSLRRLVADSPERMSRRTATQTVSTNRISCSMFKASLRLFSAIPPLKRAMFSDLGGK